MSLERLLNGQAVAAIMHTPPRKETVTMRRGLLTVATMRCLGLLLATATLAAPANAQQIIAHRGASADAPENTIAAARLAWEQGADGLEGDFQLTLDGQIVCIHDSNTKRTTGVDALVADLTLQQIQALDAGSLKGSQWKDERIPTLQDWLATVPDEQRKVYLESKCGPKIIAPMKAILEQTKLKPEQIVIIGFKDEVIAEAKRLMPRCKAYLIVSYKQDKSTGRWQPEASEVLRRLTACRADGLDSHGNRDAVTPEFVKAIQDAGFELHCWTVNNTADALDFSALGFRSITTDRPELLRSAIPAADIDEMKRLKGASRVSERGKREKKKGN